MRGTTRDEYKSDEREIGVREEFRWTASVEAPGEAIWYKGPKSYWTQRFARDRDGISLEEQDRDPKSLLNHYRRLLRLRATHPAFRSGEQRILHAPGNILAVERTGGGERLLIIANLLDRPANYRASGLDLLSGKQVHGSLRLQPYQAALIQR
jgi:glycosidase